MLRMWGLGGMGGLDGLDGLKKAKWSQQEREQELCYPPNDQAAGGC